jgi:hypothetical protein
MIDAETLTFQGAIIPGFMREGTTNQQPDPIGATVARRDPTHTAHVRRAKIAREGAASARLRREYDAPPSHERRPARPLLSSRLSGG